MAKLILSDLVNLNNSQTVVTTINNNSAELEEALENTLSRDGTAPNHMESDLDMNSHKIYNLPEALTDTEPVRRAEFMEALVGHLDLTLDDLDINVEEIADEIQSGIEANLNIREYLQDNTTFYIREDGLDAEARTGLVDSAESAFRTWQYAWDKVVERYHFNGYQVTLKAGANGGSYTSILGSPLIQINGWVGGGSLALIGDQTTPALVSMRGNAAECIVLNGTLPGGVTIDGFEIRASGGYGVEHRAVGKVVFGSALEWGACTTAHYAVDWRQSTIETNGYTIMDDADRHIDCDSGLIQLNAGTYTLSGTRGFQTFARARNHGCLISSATWVGTGTGQKFQVNEGSLITVQSSGDDSINHFPGDAPGIAMTNGVYSGLTAVHGTVSATQAEMETGTSTMLEVTPGVQKFHPAHPKAWAFITFSGGNPAISANYGISGISDEGVGITRLTLSSAMSSSNFGVVANQHEVTGGSTRVVIVNSSIVEVRTTDENGSLIDSTFSVMVFGDLA